MKPQSIPRKHSLPWLSSRLRRLIALSHRQELTERQQKRVRWLTVAVANATAREKVKSNNKYRRLS